MNKNTPIVETASVWLERQHAGNWTEQDQEGLDTWLAASSAHRAAYWRLEDAWTQAARLSALRPPAPQPGSRQRTLKIFGGAAAAAIVCGIVGVAELKYAATPQTRTYATDLGGREVLALSDGSHIELNTNTTLRISIGGNKRLVWLDKGEAYFQIAHNPAKPFQVFAAGHRITDLGTKFFVHQDKDKLEVALVEGRARVDVDGPSRHSAVLTPGQVAIVTTNKLSVASRPTTKLANELSWRQGQLTFSETTLADAVSEFNRYNAIKLVVSDSHIAQMKINGTFPTDGAEMFARVAKHALQLRTEQHGNEILISR